MSPKRIRVATIPLREETHSWLATRKGRQYVNRGACG